MPTPTIDTLTDDASKLITVNFGGKFFKCSQNTYGALLALQAALTKAYPKAWILVIQQCYHTGVVLSAGTHDYDACLDIKIVGLTWQEMQDFVRSQGWAGWWRHTGSWASPSMWHVHMALLGAPEAGCTVGKYIDGGVSLYGHAEDSSQYADYYAHRSGLVGHVPDPTWHPADIASTIFKYATWLEANMQLTAKQIDDIATAVVAKLLNTTVGPKDDLTPVRTALYKASNVPDIIRAQVAKVVTKLGA